MSVEGEKESLKVQAEALNVVFWGRI